MPDEPTADLERADLAAQLRDAWEGELALAGFRLVDGPTAGIAGVYTWAFAPFADHRFTEGQAPAPLLAAAEARVLATATRTPSHVAALRVAVQRLAKLQGIDWRIALDAQIAAGSQHPFDRELARDNLWRRVTARGLPSRLS